MNNRGDTIELLDRAKRLGASEVCRACSSVSSPRQAASTNPFAAVVCASPGGMRHGILHQRPGRKPILTLTRPLHCRRLICYVMLNTRLRRSPLQHGSQTQPHTNDAKDSAAIRNRCRPYQVVPGERLCTVSPTSVLMLFLFAVMMTAVSCTAGGHSSGWS